MVSKVVKIGEKRWSDSKRIQNRKNREDRDELRSKERGE